MNELIRNDRKIPERVSVIGVPVSAVTLEVALKYLQENQDQIRGEYICAANVHTTVMAHDDDAYYRVQSNAVMNLPDGKPLSVIGKGLTSYPMDKVSGLHFMKSVFSDQRFRKNRHFFYGTTQDILNKVVQNVIEAYPGLCVCGCEPSVFREISDDELELLAKRINHCKPDFIWVAIGAPRQEILMNRLQGKVCGIMTGVGGAFNILAGIVPDAPVWMQNAGLEWLYRLIREPKRLFKRYLVTNSQFIYYLLKSKHY